MGCEVKIISIAEMKESPQWPRQFDDPHGLVAKYSEEFQRRFIENPDEKPSDPAVFLGIDQGRVVVHLAAMAAKVHIGVTCPQNRRRF